MATVNTRDYAVQKKKKGDHFSRYAQLRVAVVYACCQKGWRNDRFDDRMTKSKYQDGEKGPSLNNALDMLRNDQYDNDAPRWHNVRMTSLTYDYIDLNVAKRTEERGECWDCNVPLLQA